MNWSPRISQALGRHPWGTLIRSTDPVVVETVTTVPGAGAVPGAGQLPNRGRGALPAGPIRRLAAGRLCRDVAPPSGARRWMPA